MCELSSHINFNCICCFNGNEGSVNFITNTTRTHTLRQDALWSEQQQQHRVLKRDPNVHAPLQSATITTDVITKRWIIFIGEKKNLKGKGQVHVGVLPTDTTLDLTSITWMKVHDQTEKVYSMSWYSFWHNLGACNCSKHRNLRQSAAGSFYRPIRKLGSLKELIGSIFHSKKKLNTN